MIFVPQIVLPLKTWCCYCCWGPTWCCSCCCCSSLTRKIFSLKELKGWLRLIFSFGFWVQPVPFLRHELERNWGRVRKQILPSWLASWPLGKSLELGQTVTRRNVSKSQEQKTSSNLPHSPPLRLMCSAAVFLFVFTPLQTLRKLFTPHGVWQPPILILQLKPNDNKNSHKINPRWSFAQIL